MYNEPRYVHVHVLFLTVSKMVGLNATVLCTIVDHGVDGLYVLIVECVTVVIDEGAPSQHAVLALLASPAHHFTVQGHAPPRSINDTEIP